MLQVPGAEPARFEKYLANRLYLHRFFCGHDYETAMIYCIITISVLYRDNADNTDRLSRTTV